MDQSFLICFVVVMIGLYMFCSLFNARYYEPSKVFLLPWIGCGLFLLLQLVTYDKVFTQSSFFTLTAGICCFVIGAVFYRMTHMKTALPRQLSPVYKFSPVILKILLAGALLYSAIEIVEVLKFLCSGGFTKHSLGEIRLAHWENYNVTTGRNIANIPKSIGRSCAMLLAMALPIFWFARRRRLAVFLSPLLILIMFEDLLNAGRSLLILTLFCLGYIYLIAKPQKKTKSKRTRRFRKMPSSKVVWLGAVVAVGMIYYLFIFFPQTRNQNLKGNLNTYLAYKHDAKISEWVETGSQIKGLQFLPGLAYGTCYLSLPIVKYTFFTGDNGVQNWYCWGGYNFHIVMKVARIITGEDHWKKIRFRIADYSGKHGYNPNPHATGVRDLVIDFGYPGMMISFLFLGFIFQLLYQKAISRNSAEWILLAGLVALNCFMFAFISPFVMGQVNQNLLLIVFLIFLKKKKPKERCVRHD